VDKQLKRVDGPAEEPLTAKEIVRLVEAVREQVACEKQKEEQGEQKKKALEAVRGISEDYHPYDKETGKPMTEEEVEKRMKKRLDALQKVVEEEGMSKAAQEGINKARGWVVLLASCVGWFMEMVKERIEPMGLSEEMQKEVEGKMMPWQYWQGAARKEKDVEKRKRQKEMVEKLEKEWREAAERGNLSEKERRDIERVGKEVVGIFARASSSVEGRNGRLALMQHGVTQLTQKRLKTQTCVQNYLVKRADGSTAAERFFGQKHADAFSWLLARLPDLPRPAAKRHRNDANPPSF